MSGFYFMPEVNQGVLVGFEGGDPQHPYIIGTLNDGKVKPDEKWVTSSNDIKAVRTKKGHTIEFDDSDGHEKLVIYNAKYESDHFKASSDAVNRITLDLHSHEIRIYSDGNIKMEAAGDIDLKGKNIHLEAKEYLLLKGQKDVRLLSDPTGLVYIANVANAGIQISNEGQIEVAVPSGKGLNIAMGESDLRFQVSDRGVHLTGPEIIIESKAKTDVTSDGVLSVKGTMVKIN